MEACSKYILGKLGVSNNLPGGSIYIIYRTGVHFVISTCMLVKGGKSDYTFSLFKGNWNAS